MQKVHIYSIMIIQIRALKIWNDVKQLEIAGIRNQANQAHFAI